MLSNDDKIRIYKFIIMKLQAYDKYEYMWPNLSGYSIKGILDQFNKLGQEGWEVITFSLEKCQALLKRKITEVEV